MTQTSTTMVLVGMGWITDATGVVSLSTDTGEVAVLAEVTLGEPVSVVTRHSTGQVGQGRRLRRRGMGKFS